jgi:hypothetical protein
MRLALVMVYQLLMKMIQFIKEVLVNMLQMQVVVLLQLMRILLKQKLGQ